jgi:hypothetical protein
MASKDASARQARKRWHASEHALPVAPPAPPAAPFRPPAEGRVGCVSVLAPRFPRLCCPPTRLAQASSSARWTRRPKPSSVTTARRWSHICKPPKLHIWRHDRIDGQLLSSGDLRAAPGNWRPRRPLHPGSRERGRRRVRHAGPRRCRRRPRDARTRKPARPRRKGFRRAMRPTCVLRMGVVPAARHAGNARRRSARRRRSGRMQRRLHERAGAAFPALVQGAIPVAPPAPPAAHLARVRRSSFGCMSDLAPCFARLYRASPGSARHRPETGETECRGRI